MLTAMCSTAVVLYFTHETGRGSHLGASATTAEGVQKGAARISNIALTLYST